MARGGRRAGAGRPKGSATRRTREIADAAMANPAITTPLDHLLKTLNNPLIGAARKDKVAESLLPYLHPRLSATAMLNAPGGSGGDSNERTLIVGSVPRGSYIDRETGEIIFPPDTGLGPFEPFKATHDWTTTALTDQRSEPEPVPFEVVELTPPKNVTRIDTFRNRRDNDDDDQGPGAT